MHPVGLVDHVRGSFVIVPVAEHHRVAANAEFACDAARHDAALRVDNLCLQMRMHAADSGDACIRIWRQRYQPESRAWRATLHSRLRGDARLLGR